MTIPGPAGEAPENRDLPTQPYGLLPAAYQPPQPPPAARQPAPGWYPNHYGQMQWWDGYRWGHYAQPGPAAYPVVVAKQKEVGIAYLFWFLLGGFAAHRFYLRRTGSAVAFLIVWWLGWFTTAFYIGWLGVVAGGIWLFCDLFLIPGMTRVENAKPLPSVTYNPRPVPPALRE